MDNIDNQKNNNPDANNTNNTNSANSANSVNNANNVPKTQNTPKTTKRKNPYGNKKLRTNGYFPAAVKNYSDNKLSDMIKEKEEKQEQEKEFFGDFEDKTLKKQREENQKSTKKHRLTKMRKKAIISSCIALGVLILFLFFFPPVMSNIPDDTQIHYYDDIFCEMGLEEYKAYAQANYSVYSEEGFSSEKSNSYRTVILCFSAHNLSPFEIKIPSYKIISSDPLYQDKICYAGLYNEVGIDDEIPPFGTETLKVRVLINASGMSDEDFTAAIDSLVIATSGMRKSFGNIPVACIPSVAFVSDSITAEVMP